MEEQQAIHVCFALHDASGTYSKYVGTAITSLFENTEANVVVHLLHDETLSRQNRENFQELGVAYRQTICFHGVPMDEYRDFKQMAHRFSVGTFFRLSLPEILPQTVTKVIYLDADIIVSFDIKELWQLNLHGYPLAAAVHEELQHVPVSRVLPWPCREGGVEPSQYFNAGVLIFDLKAIREKYHLRQECLEFLSTHPMCGLPDQDALNMAFHNHYFRLPQKYNLFTRLMKDNDEAIEGMIHISGDCVDFAQSRWWDMAFLRYWLKSPWGTGDEIAQYFQPVVRKQGVLLAFYQAALRCRVRGKGLVVWGAKSILRTRFREVFPLQPDRDCFIDHDASLQGTRVDGIPVRPPEDVLEHPEGDVCIIVLAKNAYPEIRRELEEHGFQENKEFFDVRPFLDTFAKDIKSKNPEPLIH